eukprot:1479070-Rhodomonas_salina.1
MMMMRMMIRQKKYVEKNAGKNRDFDSEDGQAMHGAQPEEQVCRRSTLSAGPWRYCGPHNGHDFSRVALSFYPLLRVFPSFSPRMWELLWFGDVWSHALPTATP